MQSYVLTKDDSHINLYLLRTSHTIIFINEEQLEPTSKLLALNCLMYVGEVALLLFFEMLLEKRLTLSYVPNFQGHTMHIVEIVAI